MVGLMLYTSKSMILLTGLRPIGLPEIPERGVRGRRRRVIRAHAAIHRVRAEGAGWRSCVCILALDGVQDRGHPGGGLHRGVAEVGEEELLWGAGLMVRRPWGRLRADESATTVDQVRHSGRQIAEGGDCIFCRTALQFYFRIEPSASTDVAAQFNL